MADNTVESDTEFSQDVEMTGTLSIPEVTQDPPNGNIWIRTDL